MPMIARFRRAVGVCIDPESRHSAARERELGLVRKRLAERYLHGSGIEIGALHKPLAVPSDAVVRYVDRMPVARLRREYPELVGWRLVEPDIVDDGERLGAIPDGSLDFVIANHFIEHTEDPLGTLANDFRVLRIGGVLYLAVPEKRETFDRGRDVTSIEHVVHDHQEGPERSRAAHYEDWARHVEKAADIRGRARQLMDAGYSIHFHVWTREAFGAFLEHARTAIGIPFRVEELVPNEYEFVAILRKEGSAPTP